jgi:hypothetical protein
MCCTNSFSSTTSTLRRSSKARVHQHWLVSMSYVIRQLLYIDVTEPNNFKWCHNRMFAINKCTYAAQLRDIRISS